jgi:phosphonate transport system permease protein
MSQTLELVLQLMVETVFLALMGTSFAIVLSIPLSFLAARNLMPRTFLGNAVYFVTRTLLNVLRSIEVLILAIIFAATVGLGPFAGVLALTVHSIASLGKLYSEAIESIDPGPLEAITATGANRLQVIMYAVVPQFIPQFISFTLYRWDINVRMSTVIGFVGGGGIGFILQQFINLGNFFAAATAIWAIAIVVMVMDWASAKIRERVV